LISFKSSVVSITFAAARFSSRRWSFVVPVTVQVLWACHAWNATPEEAARQVVADLFDLLARGGSVSVHVEEQGGKEYMLEVTARGK
jgi:hypothetical protein